mmetsp:Transcript_31208/g.36006  ORF Transcript_31208/g.36006 Transcript_31208/m.36006 type:complete len:434 (+) Transcript_31208:156-1457(+)
MDCWSDKDEIVVDKGSEKEKHVLPSKYHEDIQPILIEWLENRIKRGNPWCKELSSFFGDKERYASTGTCTESILVGSPVLDLLVTGDDSNIRHILHALRHKTSHGRIEEPLPGKKKKNSPKSSEDKFLSTMDEGMPAQAMTNWAQCDLCNKWRKLPWFFDVDTLPEKFVCQDNLWNPESNNCEAPEDVWNAEEALTKMSEKTEELTEGDFKINARFDVLRIGYRNKKVYTEAKVIGTSFDSSTKMVKFHYPRLKGKYDEWVELGSARIAPHRSFTRKKEPKNKSDEIKKETMLNASEPDIGKPRENIENGTKISSANECAARCSGNKTSHSKEETHTVQAIPTDQYQYNKENQERDHGNDMANLFSFSPTFKNLNKKELRGIEKRIEEMNQNVYDSYTQQQKALQEPYQYDNKKQKITHNCEPAKNETIQHAS